MRLRGRKVLITGAASGIGLATAALFAREGASVALIDSNGEALEKAGSGLRDEGHQAAIAGADVTSEPEVAAAVERIEPEEERKLDPVVTRLQRSIGSVPDEHFRQLRERLDARLGLPPADV